jgi:hypothetical protein
VKLFGIVKRGVRPFFREMKKDENIFLRNGPFYSTNYPTSIQNELDHHRKGQ